MSRIAATRHGWPGSLMTIRAGQAFFGHTPSGRTDTGKPVRAIDLITRQMAHPRHYTGAHRESLADRIMTVFLIFTFGVIAGYLWAAAAYGKLPGIS